MLVDHHYKLGKNTYTSLLNDNSPTIIIQKYLLFLAFPKWAKSPGFQEPLLFQDIRGSWVVEVLRKSMDFPFNQLFCNIPLMEPFPNNMSIRPLGGTILPCISEVAVRSQFPLKSGFFAGSNCELNPECNVNVVYNGWQYIYIYIHI